MKPTVTNSMLGKLAALQNDLFIHAKEGRYADFYAMMTALRAFIEGKTPEPPLIMPLPELAKWRTFQVGGMSKKALCARVKSGFSMGALVDGITKRPEFTTCGPEQDIDTIVLTPDDFGYERPPTTAELLDPAWLSQWSEQNREQLGDYAVELLPAEAGLHVRDQYKDQPSGEVLWIAMEPIPCPEGRPYVFGVQRNSDKERCIVARLAGTNRQWSFRDRILFCLRKITQE